ncbi:HNH endonuclease [Paenarthrobacter sp. MSM-2-10-13]|uniref:HNH endonuclease signature motif containing protein n=1 Tax=Paenarthrobacter sp. MSM-2-10-13 TaxID=2717318 RepID=UPI0014223E7B|nr:HNH endonuclease signature motif containing protein [Paenarthrobacter sp. MSM-2-10-13]NHW45989.1 HNH endonuclease [Paenarthrobacter sp. MSM-2-10-13]
MKKVKLSGKHGEGKFAVVDDDVAQRQDIARYKWNLDPKGYVLRYKYIGQKNGRSNYTPLLLHRQVMDAPKGTEIDHANGDRLDNRRSNLRFCTRQQNMRNRTVSNQTGYKGIYWRKQSQAYVARLTVDGRSIHAGMSRDPELAAILYDVAALQIFGEFANLNLVGKS